MPINFNPAVAHKSILELPFSTYEFNLFYVSVFNVMNRKLWKINMKNCGKNLFIYGLT